jgi:hypothetical protein
MKKVFYLLVLLMVVISGLLMANRNTKQEKPKQVAAKPNSATASNITLLQWETTPEGIFFKKWKTSPEGQKVLTDAATINAQIKTAANMEAVVTSLSLPANARLGFGVMIQINGTDYILNFGPLASKELQQLRSLQVNDKIIIRSNFVSYAPKYAYAIISGNYVERGGKLIYKSIPRKGGC